MENCKSDTQSSIGMQSIIVFLDVDGVLNDINSKEVLDDEKIAVLSKICALGDSRIVLCSSWRDLWSPGKLPKACMEMRQKLITALMKYDLEISDITPYINSHRPTECRQWLDEHEKDYDAVLILDDDFGKNEYEMVGLGDCLIHTRFFVKKNGGLQEKHIKEAKERLKRQKGKKL